MTRRECREHIMVMLFQIEFHTREELSAQMSYYMENIEKITEDDMTYMQNKFQNTLEHLSEIDSLIESVSEGWKLKRMFRVDLAIMRLAVFEMKYDEEIPVSVAINEAVEIAKKSGQDSSPSFVNGILAQVAEVIEKG